MPRGCAPVKHAPSTPPAAEPAAPHSSRGGEWSEAVPTAAPVALAARAAAATAGPPHQAERRPGQLPQRCRPRHRCHRRRHRLHLPLQLRRCWAEAPMLRPTP
eukprot:127362-Chlamydomonas_euryale.AAC.9